MVHFLMVQFMCSWILYIFKYFLYVVALLYIVIFIWFGFKTLAFFLQLVFYTQVLYMEFILFIQLFLKPLPLYMVALDIIRLL